MTEHTMKCQACGETITGELYHLGFSDMEALYCSSCSEVLLMKRNTISERFNITRPSLDVTDPGFQPYLGQLLPYFAEVEAFIGPCECGGHYGYMNPPRCPKCNGLLRGNLYEDKPINKLTEGYVFVASVDGNAQLTSQPRDAVSKWIEWLKRKWLKRNRGSREESAKLRLKVTLVAVVVLAVFVLLFFLT